MRMFLLAMAAALPWSGAALAENLPTSTPVPMTQADAETSPVTLPSEERPMVSQGNPAWRWMKLGTSATIGKAGCLALSLYDQLVALKQLSADTDPGAFVRMLSGSRLFTSTGNLRWELGKLFPGMWVERLTALGSSALQKASAALSNHTAVVLEVLTSRGTHHWVAVSRIVNGDAEIRDPNGGRIGWLSSMYGVNAVRGMAVLHVQPSY